MPPRRTLSLSIWTRIVVSLVLVLLAIGLAVLLYQTRELPERAEREGQPPNVLVMQARPVVIDRQWEGFGTARPRFSANVPAQVRGLIVEVPESVVAGAHVKRGQMLAQIDPTDFRHEVDVIEQRLNDIESQIEQLEVERLASLERLELLQEEVELARADLTRLEEAREAVGATQREVDQARQALSAAIRAEVAAREQLQGIDPRASQLRALRGQQDIALRVAVRNLERTTITSPLDGYLQSVDVEQGETVNLDQQVARVVPLDRIEVPLRLPAGARRDLEVGAEVTLESTGPRSRSWTGRIARIAPEDDEQTRTVTVYIELDQAELLEEAAVANGYPPSLLYPGQFVRGVVRTPLAQPRWVVPRRSVQSDRIRMVDDGIVESRRVLVDFQIQQSLPQLGLDDTQWAVLVQPLTEGALVIVDGARTLPEGMAVQPVLPSEQRASGEGSVEQPQ